MTAPERTDMLNWYLAYTKPKHEDSVAKRLIDAGFDILNPKAVERRLLRQKPVEVCVPLFPCYVFVRFDRSRHYHLISYTRGIKRVLSADNGPAAVDDAVVEAIAERLVDNRVDLGKRLASGDTVRIEGGVFDGLDAIFICKSARDRVSLLLKAVNVRVVVDSAMVAKG